MTRVNSGTLTDLFESACTFDELQGWRQLVSSHAEEAVYVTSELESWGQPSIVRYILVTSGNRMQGQLASGIYVSSQLGTSASDLFGYEEEPEDAVLVTSGMLPRLIGRARKESPSLNWEQDLLQL